MNNNHVHISKVPLLMNSHPQQDESKHFHTQHDVYNMQPKKKSMVA